MFSIHLDHIGKRFNNEWIFRDVSLSLDSANRYAVLGRNGSGKSTFLQTLAGKYEPSAGQVKYSLLEGDVPVEEIYRYVSICAPYLELFEEYTLTEAIVFHHQFKKFRNSVSPIEIPEILQLENAKNKQLKNYSSGMKQRVKLGLSILSDTPILLLDEPTGNLDKPSIKWYQQLVSANMENRLIVVCSNSQEQEYGFCNKILDIENGWRFGGLN